MRGLNSLKRGNGFLLQNNQSPALNPYPRSSASLFHKIYKSLIPKLLMCSEETNCPYYAYHSLNTSLESPKTRVLRCQIQLILVKIGHLVKCIPDSTELLFLGAFTGCLGFSPFSLKDKIMKMFPFFIKDFTMICKVFCCHDEK